MKITVHTPSGFEVAFFSKDVVYIYPVTTAGKDGYVVVEMTGGGEVKVRPFAEDCTKENIETLAKELQATCPHINIK